MGETNGCTNGRDPRGLFAKGNTIASGNPMNKRMRELRQRFLDCATDADIQDVYASLMESIRSGDTAAAKVLLEYLVGKPVPGIEISGPDGEPLAMGEISAVIREALADYPEAQIQVAAAFHRLGRSRNGGLPELGSSN
jgi:hypothetical protein